MPVNLIFKFDFCIHFYMNVQFREVVEGAFFHVYGCFFRYMVHYANVKIKQDVNKYSKNVYHFTGLNHLGMGQIGPVGRPAPY